MGEKRWILILGGGVMQLPAIRAAHRLGLHVIVADGNASAPGIAEADRFEHIDLRDRESMLKKATDYRRAGKLDAVFTAGTDFSSTVAFVTDALGLPGTSLDSALNATDKFRMRKVLADAGVRVPKFVVLAASDLTEQGLSESLSTVGLPAVVKPADSMGARGVVRVDDVASALSHSLSAVSHSATRRVVVEGYVDGPEFSIDALVYDGVTQITGFADRHIVFPPHFIEIGHTIPTALDDSEKNLVIAEFMRGVSALGINYGAAKGDMKISDEGAVVGEIAARLSGGYMSGWTFPLSSGVELTAKAIRIALGEAPGSLETVWDRTSAERAVISIPGTVEAVAGIDRVRAEPGICEVFQSVSAGQEVRLPTSNVEKCGNVISVGDTRAIAVHTAENGVSLLEVLLVPRAESTRAFLFDQPDGYWAHDLAGFDADWLSGIGVRTGPQPLSAFGLDPAWGRGNALRAPMGLGAVPRVAARDWSWRTLQDSVDVLASAGLVRTDRFEPGPGAAVWRGLLRGGLQGGRFVLRSLGLRNPASD